jgi:hypothetical protein
MAESGSSTSPLVSPNSVSGPDRRVRLMSERDRITDSPPATNGLPVEIVAVTTIRQEHASWTSLILTDLVHARLTKW